MAGLGLQTNTYSWALFAGLVLVWGASLKLVPTLRANGPIGMIYSLWGYAWIGFGITFVIRFLVLAYDSVNFGNESYRLADQSPETVNLTLIFLVVFWAFLSLGLMLSNRISLGNVCPLLQRMAGCEWRDLVLFVTFPSLFCTFITAPFMPVPNSLFTPLKLIASLWVIPTCAASFQHFGGRRVSRSVLFLALTPPALTIVLYPYREVVLQAVLAVLLPAAFAGRRIPLTKFLGGALVIFLASSTVIVLYRAVLWDGENTEDLFAERDLAFFLLNPLSRFHAFDSLLLTSALVPDTFPYSHRDVFTGSIVRGVIPRAIYPEKELSDRGLQFSRTIWGYENDDPSEAAIAPSMPGDLYEAGGAMYICLGAGLFGFCVGLFENSRKRMPLMLRCCFIAYFAPQFLGAAERDFAHVVSTLIQTALVANAIMLIVPTGWAKTEPLAIPEA